MRLLSSSYGSCWNFLTSIFCSASIDGLVFIWRINEGPNEDDKAHITGKIVIAIQIVGGGTSVHPRVCWHSHKQVIINLQCIQRIISNVCLVFARFWTILFHFFEVLILVSHLHKMLHRKFWLLQLGIVS